jgi:hypothetical protein
LAAQHSAPAGGPIGSKPAGYGAVGSGPSQASPEQDAARSAGSTPAADLRKSPVNEAKLLQDRQQNR